ncbi:MAG: GspH/FimT family pseudopilin [Candidatus Anammoxibacter sp.]
MIKYLHNQKGLSLIELLVVVAIIAVIIGITIPSYLRLKPTIRINGAARQIVSDLMWAKMKAVSENNDYVIVFGTPTSSLVSNAYNIYDDDNDNMSNLTNGDPEGRMENELVKTVIIPNDFKGVSFDYVPDTMKTTSTDLIDKTVSFQHLGGISWFKFEPTGRANKSGTIYLVLDEDMVNNKRERMRAITVLRNTGRVKIWSYTGSGTTGWE